MIDYNNKHLNIFHHYHQNGSIPIENNISRGLAIVLQECPLLLFLFMERINKKSELPVSFVHEEYFVNFQKRASEFDSFENVIGVALTGAELSDEETEARDSTANPITDIAIEFDDTVIIIEVKRTEEDCIAQLKEQINKINENEGKEKIISLTWEEIVELIEQYKSISNSENRILNDYYDHLEYFYPNWFPVKVLNEISKTDIEQQNKRIGLLVKTYNKTKNLNANDYIDISETNWASRLNIWADDDKKSIVFGIWPSNKKNQYWALKQKSNNYTFLSKKKKDYSVTVFIKMYDSHGRQKHRINLIDGKIDNKQNYAKLCESIIGQWKRDGENSWEKFRNIISKEVSISDEEKQKFEVFYQSLLNSNMNVFNSVLSCEIIRIIPFEDIKEFDNNKDEPNPFIDYIDEIISEFVHFIEQ